MPLPKRLLYGPRGSSARKVISEKVLTRSRSRSAGRHSIRPRTTGEAQSIKRLPSRQIASRHINSANAINTAACPRSASPMWPSEASRTS